MSRTRRGVAAVAQGSTGPARPGGNSLDWVPNVFFRSKPTRIDPDELRDRLEAALASVLPAASVEVAVGEGGEVVLTWLDGPSAAAVADVVAGVVNWEVRGVRAPATKPGAPAVLLDRRFSPLALAVAVVRFQASNVRPYDSTSATAVERLTALLEVDEPARSGYPVPDAMAALLLAAPDPDGLAERIGPGATPADRLAIKLGALGWDRLWHEAWSGVT